MKNYIVFFILLLSSFSSWGGELLWKAGKTEFKLIKVEDDGYASKSCQKTCGLKTKALAKIPSVTQDELSGGKVPASVVCKKIGGDVVYLSHADKEETFCVHGKDIVSLSLLLP